MSTGGLILGVGEVEIFFTSSCPEWSWDPLSLIKMSTGGLIVAQAAMCLATGSTARVRFRLSEGWRFSSVLTQTAPGVHSAYYKMSTAGKGGRA